MTPVAQETDDDCFRACLASLADYPLGTIPHFFAGMRNGEPIDPLVRSKMLLWFHSMGLTLIRFPLPAESEQHALWLMHESNPGPHYILTGRTIKSLDHAVVARDGQVVHDPAPARQPLISGHISGMYGVVMIGCLL